MAITKNGGRQWALAAEVTINFDDYTSGVSEAAIDLPMGSRVLGGYLYVDTAWDSATSCTIDVGDGGTQDLYISNQNGKTADAGVSFTTTAVGKKYALADTIDVNITDVGAPTVGSATLVVYYTTEGKANEVVPDV